jgi:hypothetical protein
MTHQAAILPIGRYGASCAAALEQLAAARTAMAEACQAQARAEEAQIEAIDAAEDAITAVGRAPAGSLAEFGAKLEILLDKLSAA